MFVCLGNICRSPTAHGLFAARVKSEGMDARISVCSSGTAGYHIGEPPDARSVDAAMKRGVDISGLRASQFCVDDFLQYDYILAMDKQNLSDLTAMQPQSYDGHLGLFLDFAAELQQQEVPDPYYGGAGGFKRVVELIDAASEGLLEHIRQHHFG